MQELTKGDICLVDFNPSKGREIEKLRPAIILSSTEEISILTTVIVIPLSTIIENNTLPYRYQIRKRDKLEQTYDACIYEICTLSKVQIKDKLCILTDNELLSIKKALCSIIG